jgi:hypothetical protein
MMVLTPEFSRLSRITPSPTQVNEFSVHRITSILAGGTFVAQSSRNPPPAISLISNTLASKSREASPHSFMFQYPPSHLNTRCLVVSNGL